MDNRIEQLEYTVMELGTEIFRLKSQINEMTDRQTQLNCIVKSIQSLLDEKGIVEADDLEVTTSLHSLELEGEDGNLDLDLTPTGTKTEYH